MQMVARPKIQAKIPSPSEDCVLEQSQLYTLPLMAKV